MERATRYGSCFPVTTIRIPPIWTRDQWATHPSMHPEVYFNPLPGVIGSTEDTSYGMGACRGSLLALPRHPAPARKSRTGPTSSKPQAISTSHANGKAFAELRAGFDR